MAAIDQPSNFSSALPMLVTVACALPGMLAGLTLSEIIKSPDAQWSGLLWIPLLTSSAIGLALATVFSPRFQFLFARSPERVLAGNSTRIMVTGATLGLSVTVLSLLTCMATSVWSFDWTTWWACIGASPIYGALAGLGVITMSFGANAR